MKLWCSKCHTLWTEGVLSSGKKCPFTDCAGWLTATEPPTPNKPHAPKTKPSFPLLEREP